MSLVASDPALIGVDWGTTSFRAYLIDGSGHILDSLKTRQGILHTDGTPFEDILSGHLAAWLKTGQIPVVASGMITSRNGWVETPYVALPGGVAELASELVHHKTRSRLDVYFVPGLTTENNGLPDVMRGEETQIIGAAFSGLESGVFVLPGTHSKWVSVSASRVTGYATFMTGEIYEALRSHTILGKLSRESAYCEAALALGVRASEQAGTELLHTLFSARTLPLFGRISQEMTADYLSGLLIGAEIQGARKLLGEYGTITIVGHSDLAQRYEDALGLLGVNALRSDDDIAARGHFEIARAGALI